MIEHRTAEEIKASIERIKEDIQWLDERHEILTTEQGREAYLQGVDAGTQALRTLGSRDQLQCHIENQRLRALRSLGFFDVFTLISCNPYPLPIEPIQTNPIEEAWRNAFTTNR